MLANEKINFNL